MPMFRYKAVAATGDIVEGAMEAATRGAVIARLQQGGHVPIRADAAGLGFQPLTRLRALLPSRGSGVDLLMLTQQLAMLLRAGLALDRALEFIAGQSEAAADREAVRLLLEKIRGGRSLADALAAQPDIFPKYYAAIVRAGEASATLDASFEHLAGFLEQSKRARGDVVSALIYPGIVLLTGLGSLAMLFGFVVPSFKPLFADSETALPLVTRLVLLASDGLAQFGPAFLGLAVLGAVALRLWLRTAAGRSWWDRLALRLPLFGTLIAKAEVARFALILGTLLKSGASPLTALAIARDTVRNQVIAEAVAAALDGVKEGRGLAEPLAQTGVVPALAVNLIRVGEETARLDDMLHKVATILEQENRRTLDRLLALLVPGVTVVLGVLVAVVVGAILTAVLSVYDLAL